MSIQCETTAGGRVDIVLPGPEDVYRILFDANPQPMWVVDGETYAFLAVNDAAVSHYGYTREEFLSMNSKDIRPPEDVPVFMARVAGVAGDHGRAGIWRHLKKDGTRIECDIRWYLLDFCGRLGLLVLADDISERKHAENTLREGEQRYREVFENANDIIYTHDLEGNFTSLNQTGERLTGYTREEALNMNVAQVVAPEHLVTARRMTGLKEQHDQATVYELEIIAKTGRRIALELSTRLVYRDGKPAGVLGIGRDITERRLTQNAIATQAERLALTERIAQAIRQTLDVSKVFETAVRELGGHLKVDRCSLFMKDEFGGRVLNVAEYRMPNVKPAGQHFELSQLQPLSEAMEKHGVLAFDDIDAAAQIPGLSELVLKPFDIKSIMYVPVRIDDDLPGAFALSTTSRTHKWSEADIELARGVADQTGIAIRQAKLYQAAKATSIREKLANKLSLAIRASLSSEEVLRTATRELGTAMAASRVQVRLCDLSHREPAMVHEYVAPDGEGLGQVDAGDDDFLRRYFLSAPRPLVIADARHYAEGAPELSDFVRARAARGGVVSQLDYPLTVNGQYRGIISIHQAETTRHWAEDEVLLVKSVATQLANGIGQAELFELVERGKQDWETTFDAMSDGIFIFDRSGRLVRANRAGAAMEDTTPDLLLGRQCCDILRVGSDGAACIVERTVRESKSVNVEIVPERLNRPLLATVEPVLNKSGRTVGAVCTARDLTELRNVEAVARERQTLLQNILECAREVIYALDTEGRYQWCNQAMIDLSGYGLDEIIGHHFLEHAHEGDHEMRRRRFAAVLRGELQSFETRYHARGGRLRYALVNHAPIVVDGRITGVLGIAHDVTEQKQERERAARADKLRALGQLASGVAHDFNNSLAAILGRAQLMRRRIDDENLLRSLTVIETAAGDAAATVRRIQTFAHKPVAREFGLLDVSRLLRDAIEITRTTWQNEARVAGLDIEVNLEAGDELLTRGNASELREVFVNLIVNAVDAMPEGGQLKISAARQDDRLCLRFTDTGTGMEEDVRERVFEPFYTTKGVQGTGLGLAVSYGIIEGHDGTIMVESKLGKGATFLITLPVGDKENTVTADDREGPASASLSVLVIDDEEVVRDTLAAILSDMDHKVVTADGGRDALTKIDGGNFDLVFTDLAMPEMDGWETARAIRRQRPELPVLLVTGYGATTTAPVAEPNLVAGIIGKPFDFDKLAVAIAKACDRPGARV
jgi:PAS domain S-box-containing protein